MKRTALIFLFLAPILLFPQQKQIDSIKAIIAKSPGDTALVNAWLAYDNLIYLSDPQLDEELNKKIYRFSAMKMRTEKNKTLLAFYRKKLMISMNNIGIINMYRSDNDTARHYFELTLKLAEELGDKERVAAGYNNLGVLDYRLGKYGNAIEYYTRGLTITELMGDHATAAASMNNIASIYKETGDTAKALALYWKSIETGKKANARHWEAISYSAIAEVLLERGKPDSAKILLDMSIRIDQEMGNRQAYASDLANLARIDLKQKNYAAAKPKLDEAMQIFIEMNDLRAEGLVRGILCTYYYETGDYNTALTFGKKSLEMQMKIGQVEEAERAANMLYNLYKKKGDYKNSLEMKELSAELHDSVHNQRTTKAVIRQEIQYQYAKQAALDSIKRSQEKVIQDAVIARQDAELSAKRNVQIALVIGLLMLVVFSIFIYNRFKISREQNKIIEKQRAIVELKNSEILDSINYAKRLQDAILPSQRLVKQHLPESFVLYRPKDIVAGDFYWLEPSGNATLFAACDCTGHGVPGAMISVICNTALNRSVREYGLTDPGKILDKTREIVLQEFEKSESDVLDGMDVSLCCIRGNTLKWAGANNPMWLIRKNPDGEFECIDYRPDKQPIGHYSAIQKFTTHEVPLQKGDSIYVFSDGFQDQFGGEKGKKFKSSNMKKLLLSIQDKNMEEQKSVLDKTLNDWMGEFEQVDDICVMGVRV